MNATRAALPNDDVPSKIIHKGPLSHSRNNGFPPFTTASPDRPAARQNAYNITLPFSVLVFFNYVAFFTEKVVLSNRISRDCKTLLSNVDTRSYYTGQLSIPVLITLKDVLLKK